jgi:hypothetical protein
MSIQAGLPTARFSSLRHAAVSKTQISSSKAFMCDYSVPQQH